MAEYIKVPAGVYDMVTRCMEQEFPDHVAIRYVAEDGKTVVEKEVSRVCAGHPPDDGLSQGRSAGHQGPAHRSAEPELL